MKAKRTKPAKVQPLTPAQKRFLGKLFKSRLSAADLRRYPMRSLEIHSYDGAGVAVHLYTVDGEERD